MNRFLYLLFLLALVHGNALAQAWQQKVDYSIDARLNDEDHSVDGFEAITYKNNSPDTLRFIWFHLWPNAYKNDKTAFSEQRLLHGDTRFYFSEESEKGYINRLNFKVDDRTATLEDHPLYIDVVKLLLPEPLAPGKTIAISTPFHLKLPAAFSRSGHEGQAYHLTQWYPKPAVYDDSGWHPMPYLEEAEFYSEFGNFDVSITLPANYVVAASGELMDSAESEWLKTRSNYEWEPIISLQKKKGQPAKKSIQEFPLSESGLKTLHYRLENVHDFAWFADKRFRVKESLLSLQSGKQISVRSFYLPAAEDTWKYANTYLEEALNYYSATLGDYPYPSMNAVQSTTGDGGMEYPGITLISPVNDTSVLRSVLIHETGHNWFYGVLASNERDYPWMDEGMNTYYQEKILGESRSTELERLMLESAMALHRDQPINSNSEDFSAENYYLIPYTKAAAWMRWIADSAGQPAFENAMRNYYQQWKFHHPSPADFKKTLQTELGSKLPENAFSYLQKTGPLPGWERQGSKVGFVLSKAYKEKMLTGRQKNLIGIGPALGYNSYDKLMLGAFVTNYALPPTRFRFFVAPVFATGSQSLRGLGTAEYYFYPDKGLSQVRISMTAAHFGKDDYMAENGDKPVFSFTKLVPAIRFSFHTKPGSNTVNNYLDLKSYIIGEENLRVYRDTTIVGTDTSYSLPYEKTRSQYVINQLTLNFSDYRVLYPYRLQFRAEQSRDFLRSSFTADYFFNYPKKGGLTVRFFAGKFWYLGGRSISKAFATDRYQLNMTGANGYEDYTYSDYFIGRNDFEGLPSQQIMVRDGAFKVRTDLLSNKIGKTDNWLIATNWETTIPDGINPFSILPFNLPVRLFADVGTYADAWEANSDLSHFLYDAGISLHLFRNTVKVYVPLLYSKSYRDYFRSTLPQKGRFLKTVSFAIDISNFELRRKMPKLPL